MMLTRNKREREDDIMTKDIKKFKEFGSIGGEKLPLPVIDHDKEAKDDDYDDSMSMDGNDEDNLEEEEEEEEEEETTAGLDVTGEDGENHKQFAAQVKRMCQLEDEIKQINRDRKVLADEKNELRKTVIGYMTTKNIENVNYGENETLYVEVRETSGSLTRKKLVEAIKAYHEVSDINVSKEQVTTLDEEVHENLADAEAMYVFIEKYLGKAEKVVLIREAREKKKRNRKIPERLSVYSKK